MKTEIWIKHTAEERRIERRAELSTPIEDRWELNRHGVNVPAFETPHGVLLASTRSLGDGGTQKLDLLPQ